jgi:hypothetical protein
VLRRTFFKTLSLIALAGPAADSARAAAPSKPRADLIELAGAAALGAAAAQQFLRFAESRLAEKDPTYAACAASGAEMLAACDALMALAASDAPFACGFARTAADLCAASRKDCEKFLKVAECATFATAAAACEAACRKAAGG